MDRNDDGLYDNNLECHWSILCGPNQLVELQIVSVDVEEDTFCAFDYIEVSYPPVPMVFYHLLPISYRVFLPGSDFQIDRNNLTNQSK